MVVPNVRLDITPEHGLTDTPIAISANGLPAQVHVTISARCVDAHGNGEWTSHGVFETDDQGRVDLSVQRPVSGSYATVDPNGLIWSLSPSQASDKRRSIQQALEPLRIDFHLELDGATVASQSIERLALAPSVQVEEIRDDIHANVFLPEGEGPFPTVLVLAGSGGGFPDATAALLASHGYAAISLAYFGVEGLPDDLVNIPLEYFESAFAWIAEQPQFDPASLVALGTSRGGELALLLGSRYQQVRGVVAYVPSGYLWGAVTADNLDDSGTDFPSWTYQGQPLPYVARVRNDDREPESDGSLSLTPAFLRYIEDEDRTDPATISVENINGPVILLSGDDDDLWPSAQFSQLIEQRLRQRGFDFHIESHMYPGAGHSIGQPYLPTTMNSGLHPVRGVVINFGGSAEANAWAREDSWNKVLAFLQRHFGGQSARNTAT